jgi:signal transduction histidine kinase
LASLPFRAKFVTYYKDDYREYRNSDGSGGWTGAIANYGQYASGTGNVREIAIPWSAINQNGGLPTHFVFFGYLTSSRGYVYGQVPNDNPGVFIGTGATYTQYYNISNTGNGPVHIEQVIADGQSYDASSGLRLPPLVRDLAIGYTGLSFVAPEKVLFRYKLEGWDRDWQNVGNRRYAFYTNLAPGHYRFRVTACNNSGVWNEQGASLDFAIAPTYYQTRWFQLSCVAAFMVLLWVLYRMRLRQLARQFNLRLEERVNERTRIARDLHDTLLQSFHGLLLRFQTASELFPTRTAEAKQTLDSAIEQAAQAITEGRDAVQGLRSSTVVTNDLALAINTLGEELAGGETNPNAAEFHVRVERTPRALHPILRDEVYRIAGEALRNAFRYAEAGRIEVEIRYDERQFGLRVRDDGKGIDSKLLNDDERPGHYGMRGMRERAKLLGGKLTVWSEVEAGTEVELSIPAAKAYATADGRRRSWLAEKFAGKLVEKDTQRKS